MQSGFLVMMMIVAASGFTVPSHSISLRKSYGVCRYEAQITKTNRQRTVIQAPRSSVQMGLFGLGVPEIAVILGIAGFVLGPEKLTGMAKDLGKVAGELKEVPKEFAEGMKETSAADEAAEEVATKEKESV